MKQFLPSIIDDSQSAFVPGQMIFDNIIMAHEMIHAMQNKRISKTSYLVAKIDMSKACDRIDRMGLFGRNNEKDGIL